MIIKIYPQNPNEKSVAQAADILARDGVIIYPTDSVYAFGCSLKSTKAIERIRAITGKTGPDFSIICPDLSVVAAYAKVDNTVFKLLKRNLPGPFTFILNASGKIPTNSWKRKKRWGYVFRITAFRSRWSKRWAIQWSRPRSKTAGKRSTRPTRR